MAVTELALIRAQPSVSVKSPELLENLSIAKSAMESATSATFYYYHCIEDPSLIYILGSWPSISAHMDSFIPSPQNQHLLQILKDQIAVEWMFHIDVDQAACPLTKITESPVVAIGRHFISSSSKRQAFHDTFNANRKFLDSYIGAGDRVIGGWRIDRGAHRAQEEFLLLTGWQSVEQHMGFAKTDGFEKYAQIRAFVEAAEIKHAKRLQVGIEKVV